MNRLTGGHKRTAYVLATEIQNLAKDFGIEHLGFLTLTFADQVTNIREAQRRFNSLNTHVLKSRYKRAIGCWERQKSGRIHFHLVVVLGADIRAGFDFQAIEKCDYRSASKSLRTEWAFWRNTAPKYRFGRTELLPVKSTAEGIARYVGKYVSKHVGQRLDQDKGARVVRFIGFKPGDRRASSRFAWNSDGAWLWRQKLKIFCGRHHFGSTDDLARLLGPRWAYAIQSQVMATQLTPGTVYRSEKALLLETTRENKRAVLDYAVLRMREHHAASPLEIESSGATESGATQEVEGEGTLDHHNPATLKANLLTNDNQRE